MKNYLYDGSFEGLLTVLFYAYVDKEPVLITKEKCYTPHLLDQPYKIPVEKDKFERVYSSIEHKLSPSILSNIYHLYLSETLGCENLILNYLKLCYRYGVTINLAKNNDTIIQVDTLCRKVSHEVHRFTGFVRFNKISPLCFYAQIEPDHHILPLLSHHFTTRFSDQNFIIHDLRRSIALVYDQNETYLQVLTTSQVDILKNLHVEDHFQILFKSFYDSITIKERANPRLQKTFVPQRYWKHLAEMSTL